VDGFVRELDRLEGHRFRDVRHRDGLLGKATGSVGSELDTGGEPPRAVVHDPDRQAELDAGRGVLHDGVMQRDALMADALDADVGVFSAELVGAAQAGVGERSEREGGEGGIDRGRHEPEPSHDHRGRRCGLSASDCRRSSLACDTSW